MEQQLPVAQQPSGAVVAAAPMAEMTVAEMKRRKDMVTACMREVMIKGQHFGEIPGTKSMSLLKPGAEMLGMMFRLHPHFDTQIRELENSHREYTVTCTLTANDGFVVARGLGLCSTRESKYRWRNAQKKCPDCGHETVRKSKDGRGFYCWAKIGGCGATFGEEDTRITRQKVGKVENPDIADMFNTVLKMAVKRAHVGAILLATSASDMFKQEEEAPMDLNTDPPAESPVSEGRELAAECAKLASKLKRDRDSIADLLKSNGITPPNKGWGELSLDDLAKAKGVLEQEAKLVGGK